MTIKHARCQRGGIKLNIRSVMFICVVFKITHSLLQKICFCPSQGIVVY